MVNDFEVKAGDFTLYLNCDGLDRVGASRLAFVLQFWALWGKLPKEGEVNTGAVLLNE